MTADEAMGMVLVLLRVRHSMTQRELATRLSLSDSQLGRIERGASPLPSRLVQRVVTIMSTKASTIHRMAEQLQAGGDPWIGEMER